MRHAMPDLAERRRAARLAHSAPERQVVDALARSAQRHLGAEQRRVLVDRARALVASCRGMAHEAGTLEAFLHEFGLQSREGVALMCLAETLLRVPDDATADRVIAENLAAGNWTAHLGHSPSLFVNASVWGLMLTGRLVTAPGGTGADPHAWLGRLVGRIGEPLVRAAIMQAMRILSGQFVLGRSIEEALARAGAEHAPGTRFSFDMLGEGARTAGDAKRYLAAYRHAIDALGKGAATDSADAPGISVKLSALHPRYEFAQRERVVGELLPTAIELATRAKARGIGFNIDAEESRRLDLSMDLFEALAQEPRLDDWDGLGFVLQAYQKRAPAVARWLVALAGGTGRRLAVRLVKGAYWDAEIKRAQELGLPDYPVFTRKANTDLCYEVCAATLLAAGDAIHPQFATHNAHTICSVLALADETAEFEFQRLHGMGALIYERLREAAARAVPVRVYAPVGAHRDLLPYLVRRLLENGANSSFVNRFLDADTPVETLVQDAMEAVRSEPSRRHPGIPRPAGILRTAGEERTPAAGLDLEDPLAAEALLAAVREAAATAQSLAGPIIGGQELARSREPVRSPADHRRIVGHAAAATTQDVEAALALATAAQPDWDARAGAFRAKVLERAADAIESDRPGLMALIAIEAGRTMPDALSEAREAVDFCRYYAAQARERFASPAQLPGPTGERNELGLRGRGAVACISPWNFPLAIFVGQVAAALAAGNAVLAKPAEQTPLIAARAVRLMHAAGVPADALHLLPGAGATVGTALVTDLRTAAVAFTGSTATAQRINQALAARPGPIVPFIAETGGQNVMLVDSTALPEQVVDDAVRSAFGSAGQRCSALRVLFLQEDIADSVGEMLAGAIAELAVGDPAELATDVGPVIDAAARRKLLAHTAALERSARLIARASLGPEGEHGSFVAPCAFEIASLDVLDGEVFGPILHVVRYRAADVDRVIDAINATGYGLTLGIHSRLDAFAEHVCARAKVGNVYVNRNMIGAVVGMQPFGGEGLSGTGPKAGGPNYLPRFAVERTRTTNLTAKGGDVALFGLSP